MISAIKILCSVALLALVFISPVENQGKPTQRTSTAPSGCLTPGVAAAADALAKQFDDHQFVFIGSTHGDLKIEAVAVSGFAHIPMMFPRGRSSARDPDVPHSTSPKAAMSGIHIHTRLKPDAV